MSFGNQIDVVTILQIPTTDMVLDLYESKRLILFMQ